MIRLRGSVLDGFSNLHPHRGIKLSLRGGGANSVMVMAKSNSADQFIS